MAVGMCIGIPALALLGGLLTASVSRAEATSSQSSDAQVHIGGNGTSVSITNGAVTIDGETVPPDAEQYTSRRGNHYRINRQGGSVTVHPD
jgi:hypothetical protein